MHNSINNSEEFIKLVLIGDSGVGKSCILKRYIQNKFVSGFYNTIGVQFATKHLKINNKKCKLQIWDTAGQQRFRAITSNYYKGAHGIMVVFDVTQKQSFDNLSFWLQQIQKYGYDKGVIVIIGNKCDLTDKRIISETKADQFARQKKCQYIEVSALSSANIDLVFETIAKRALREKQGSQNTNMTKDSSSKSRLQLGSQQGNKKRNQCC